MNAQQMFVASCAAMLDDCWAERVRDEIDAAPEQVVLPWEEHAEDTLDYESWQIDEQWLRWGQW